MLIITNMSISINFACLPVPCSDEDTDVKALVSAWLKSLPQPHPDSDPPPPTSPSSSSSSPSPHLESWIDDHFYRCLDWVVKSGDLVVGTTLVGVAMNGLSHLVGVSNRAEFACALVRGLGGNLSLATREKFAKEVKLNLYMYIHVHICTCVCTYIIMHSHLHACMYNVHVYTCTCTYIHIQYMFLYLYPVHMPSRVK